MQALKPCRNFLRLKHIVFATIMRCMKVRCLFLLWLFALPCSVFADIEDSRKKQAENAEIIAFLGEINSLDLAKTSQYNESKHEYAYNFDMQKRLSRFGDPLQFAKAFIFAYYLAWPGNTYDLQIDRIFCAVDLQYILKYKHHKNFVSALELIERVIWQNAHLNEQFSGILLQAKDIDAVKKRYNKRIREAELQILQSIQWQEKKKQK